MMDSKNFFSEMNFPAVRMKIGSRIYEAKGTGERVQESLHFRDGSVDFYIRIEKLSNKVWRKTVTIRSRKELPTPEWVETDRQTVSDTDLTLRGYRATCMRKGRPGAEEEGGGLMPGCGYPLIGKHFFVGAEHPAAFVRLEEKKKNSTTYSICQHPVWDTENTISLAGVVFCCSTDAEESFKQYLSLIRIPPLEKPIFSLCTFWSDPYLGNYEYLTSPETYRNVCDAFCKLGIIPDVYTLDAGWQNRKSILKPKSKFGGDKGLLELAQYFRKRKSNISLWISHNGPMGIDPEYMEKRGFHVGSGESALYCGTGFGVLLDPKYEKVLGDRLVELARSGVMLYKVDWDNECAVNDAFREKYPTQDHVREGSVNAMIRIAARIRKENPHLAIRNGQWLSPWWLMHSHHLFLPDSNDSEYTTLPSRTQRDSAATYRDTMYYCSFQRDRSAFPLDAIDNHEFPHALRNPFHETPGTAADITMLAVMRGTSYLPLTLHPDALEEWNAKILKEVMAFARAYGKEWYSSDSSMFGGNPNAGKIYGFRFKVNKNRIWCVFRNPAAFPQKLEGTEGNGVWIYPYFAKIDASKPIIFAPHEVKVGLFSSKQAFSLPYAEPFQARKSADGKTEFYFPAQKKITGQISPMIREISCIDKIETEWNTCKSLPDGLEFLFKIKLPYRMRETTLNIVVSSDKAAEIQVECRISRKSSDCGSCCQLPVTKIVSGIPGSGEDKNPDTVPKHQDVCFTIPCAEGGEDWYSVFLYGVKDVKRVRLSVSGYFAASFNCQKRSWHPAWLASALPPSQPNGFPTAEFLEIPSVMPGKNRG